MITLADQTGLICGYLIRPSGAELIGWDDIPRALQTENGIAWLHFNLADMRARHWIESCERIPRRARETLLASDQHIRLEPIGTGIAGVVGDFHHHLHDESGQVGQLRLFVDEHCMISARRLPLKAVDLLRHSISEGATCRQPIDLVIELEHHLGDALAEVIGDLSDQIGTIEDVILAGDTRDQGTVLGRVRRQTARIRRNLIPVRHALVGLLPRLPPWVGEPQTNRLRQAVERLDGLVHDLDLVQEQARLLQDELSNRLMEETNHNLYILSIVTVIFLPMTLVSGIFGMNLGGMPWLQSHTGFWIGMALIAFVAIGTVVAMRRWRLI